MVHDHRWVVGHYMPPLQSLGGSHNTTVDDLRILTTKQALDLSLVGISPSGLLVVAPETCCVGMQPVKRSFCWLCTVRPHPVYTHVYVRLRVQDVPMNSSGFAGFCALSSPAAPKTPFKRCRLCVLEHSMPAYRVLAPRPTFEKS